MTHPLLPTFSSHSRTINCPGSCALPQINSADTPERAKGRARHAYLAAIPSVGAEKALVSVPAICRDEFSQIALDGLPLFPEAVQEIAVALDLSTGKARELGRNIDRSYAAAALAHGRPLGALEVFGTADVGYIAGGAVHCADYKGGWGDVGPLAEHWQLLGLLLALCRLWGKTHGVIWRLRILDDGRTIPDALEVSSDDLDLVEQRLTEMAGAIFRARSDVAAGRAPPVQPGEWCERCPVWSAAACPAKNALMHEALTHPETFRPPVLSSLTPAELTAVYLRVRDARQVIDRIFGEVYAFGAFNLIPVSPGRAFGKHEYESSVYDGAITFDVFNEALGLSVAKKAVRMEAKDAWIGEALQLARERAPKDGPKFVMAQARRELDAKISKLGGIKMVRKSKIEEHNTTEEPGKTAA